MSASMQWFCPTTARFLRSVGETASVSPACCTHVGGLNCDPKMVQGKFLSLCAVVCVLFLEVVVG